jgi:hypothetical protein
MLKKLKTLTKLLEYKLNTNCFKESDMLHVPINKTILSYKKEIQRLNGTHWNKYTFMHSYLPSLEQFLLVNLIDHSVLLNITEYKGGEIVIKANRVFWLNELANFKNKLQYLIKLWKQNYKDSNNE